MGFKKDSGVVQTSDVYGGPGKWVIRDNNKIPLQKSRPKWMSKNEWHVLGLIYNSISPHCHILWSELLIWKGDEKYNTKCNNYNFYLVWKRIFWNILDLNLMKTNTIILLIDSCHKMMRVGINHIILEFKPFRRKAWLLIFWVIGSNQKVPPQGSLWHFIRNIDHRWIISR